MRRWLTIFGFALLAVCALLVGGLLLVMRTDWNEYRAPLARAVEDVTGRALALDGELRVEIGLRPGVSVSDVSLANAAWGTRPEMARLERVAFHLKLIPLLFSRIEVGHVELIGLDLLLETSEEGIRNWDFRRERAATERPDEVAPEPGTEPSDVIPAEVIAATEAETGVALTALIRNVEIENAAVHYHDARSGETHEFVVDDLEASMRSESAPFRFRVAAHYEQEPIALEGELAGASGALAGRPIGIDIALETGGLSLDLEGGIERPLIPEGIDLTLRVEGETLASLAPLARRPLPDLGPYRLATRLTGDATTLRAQDLAVALGELRLEGEAGADIAGERPRLEATLHSPKLDLVPIQTALASVEPPPVSAAPPPRPAPGGRLLSSEPLSLDALRSVDAEASVRFGEVRVNDLELGDVEVAFTLDGGKLVVEPFSTSFVGGRIGGAVTIDASGERPSIATAIDLRGLDAGALARRGGSQALDGGRLDADLDVRGSGASVRAIAATLRGKLKLEMGPGMIHHDYAETAFADVGQIGDGVDNRGTELNCIAGAFDVASGVARPSGLVIDTRPMAFYGAGEIDLRRERLDLRFDRQAHKASLSAVLPPFKLTGPLGDVSAGIDAKGLGTKVLDLTSFGGKKGTPVTERAEPRRCRQLMANYALLVEQRGAHKEQAEDIARKANEAGKSAAQHVGSKGKSTFDKMKGLLRRNRD